jgi:hypothetical protein
MDEAIVVLTPERSKVDRPPTKKASPEEPAFPNSPPREDLHLNIDNHDLSRARKRIEGYMTAFARDGTRLTSNPDFA